MIVANLKEEGDNSMYNINVVRYSRYKKGIIDLMELAENETALENWACVCKKYLRDDCMKGKITPDEYTRLRAFITKFYIERLVKIV